MKQIEFMWKMKSAGLEVRQTTGTVVKALIAPEVILEHSTHVDRELITLVIGEIGTDGEINIAIDTDADKLEKVLEMHEANATKEDYIKAFKR